jgi:hypothetical protein
VQIIRAFGPTTRRAATDFARKGHPDSLGRALPARKAPVGA